MNSDLFSQKLSSITTQLQENSHLLIVSKTRSIDEIKTYYNLGHRDFGENRVQELLEKSEALKKDCPEIRWHMIGNLQSNKINQLFSVNQLWAIHSVDNEELVHKLLKAENKLTHSVKVFLQYNTSKEVQKAGFEDLESLKKAVDLFSPNGKIQLFGLMTMGTLRTESFENEARRCFRELATIRDGISKNLETSMGMSQDYKIALEEKTNWIRLGTMMFT